MDITPVAEWMHTPGAIVAVIVAVQHFGFMALETFMWRGRARAVFRMSAEKANNSAQLAANQGYYNGLLAVGLLLGVFMDSPHLKSVFCAAVAGAGVFGWLTVAPVILFAQALPATVGFVLCVLGQMPGSEATVAFAVFGGFIVATALCGAFIRNREASLRAHGESAALVE